MVVHRDVMRSERTHVRGAGAGIASVVPGIGGRELDQQVRSAAVSAAEGVRERLGWAFRLAGVPDVA